MGILDDYKAQLEKDRQNENTLYVTEDNLTEESRELYEKRLNELRNDPNDIENVYKRKMSEMIHLNEDEMTEKSLIKDEDVDKVIVKHAYCSECGEELISKAPPMFNPFTFERVCKHECTKCGSVFNLEHAYPRIVFLNNKGEEINAYGR